MTDRARTIGLAAAVVAVAIAAHGFAIQNGFVDFDDDGYVFANTHVTGGLTWDGIRWAFTTGHAANYHPLTWLSHMLDVTLWGLNPAGHHATSILLHALNSLLLFGALSGLTRRARESWVVALVFAVHPLHVESVAWVSERKDLLCAFFTLLALLGYGIHARTKKRWSYFVVLAAFVLALLSKPMAVTLPFLLLVIDYWPLERMRDPALGDTFPKRCRALMWEKTPLFCLSFAACVVTYVVQKQGGAMNPLYRLPLAARLENAVSAYAFYLWKMVWPFDLSPIYPLPVEKAPWWIAALSVLLLGSITGAAWIFRKRAPCAMAGWLWYVGMLAPVIGIVQIGYASMADRYMYIPMVGILIAVVWTGAQLLRPYASERLNSIATAVGFVAIAALASLSQRQTAVWRDSESLFTHAITVTNDNAEAYAHLGVARLRQNEPAEAIAPLVSAVRIRPRLKEAHTSLGVAYRMTGQPEKAIAEHEESLRMGRTRRKFDRILGSLTPVWVSTTKRNGNFARPFGLRRTSTPPTRPSPTFWKRKGKSGEAAEHRTWVQRRRQSVSDAPAKTGGAPPRR